MTALSDLIFAQPAADTITFERRIPGSARLFWRLWTEPGHLKRWWGPDGATTTLCQIDLRIGGIWRLEFTSERYGDKILQGVYTVLDAPHRLSFTWAWEEDGRLGHQSEVTLRFRDDGAACVLSLEHAGLTPEQAETHPIGWRLGLEGFTAYAVTQS